MMRFFVCVHLYIVRGDYGLFSPDCYFSVIVCIWCDMGSSFLITLFNWLAPFTLSQNTLPAQISCDLTGEKNPSVASAGLGDMQFSNYWTAMTDLVLAYYYTENSKYATRAADLTRKFFLNAATLMAPNMKYGQLWPGVCVYVPSTYVGLYRFTFYTDFFCFFGAWAL